MKLKATLIAAATLAVGVISSQAQVYSQNIVGYVNLTITNGFSLIANPLDYDGTGTNNTLYTTLGTNWPNLTKVYSYTPAGGYKTATFSTSSGLWTGSAGIAQANQELAPGGGVFISVPGTFSNTITLAGQIYPVKAPAPGYSFSGTNILTISPGFQILSAGFPVSAGIQTGLGYVPTHLDKVYLYNGGYSTKTYNTGTTWVGGEPTPAVGQAFYLNAVSSTNWVQSLNIQ
jgi:hypothetical protein